MLLVGAYWALALQEPTWQLWKTCSRSLAFRRIQGSSFKPAALRAGPIRISTHNAMSSCPRRTWSGSCHCGAVRFEIDSGFPELTTCDCSICRRKNALMVKVHESGFRLLSDKQALGAYRFHTHAAIHYFCKTCGIYPFHRKRVMPDHLGINVFCLDNFDPSGIPVRATAGADMP